MKKIITYHDRDKPYLILAGLFLYFIAFGFVVDSPTNIYNGLYNIITSQGLLVSDYIAIGGIGAGLVNGGIVGLFILIIFRLNKAKLNGSLLMTILIVTGFAFFGKNIFNMSPIILGGYIYAKVNSDKFGKYLLTTFLATSLSPVVFQVSFLVSENTRLNTTLGVLIGVSIGFIMPAVASNAMKSNGGYNLYNVGFSAGILGIVILAVFNALGLTFPLNPHWATEYNSVLYIFIVSVCLYFIIIGVILGKSNVSNMLIIFKSSGKLLTDYYWMHNYTSFLNAGLVGLLGVFVIYIIDAPVNGPTMGAVLTMISFGFLGKHLFNCIPVIIGALIGASLSVYSLSSPSIILGLLFVTGIAPIAGTFGFLAGVLAGILHIVVVVNVTSFHGGLNLYNNGLAGGIVVMVIAPLFVAFRKGDYN